MCVLENNLSVQLYRQQTLILTIAPTIPTWFRSKVKTAMVESLSEWSGQESILWHSRLRRMCWSWQARCRTDWGLHACPRRKLGLLQIDPILWSTVTVSILACVISNWEILTPATNIQRSSIMSSLNSKTFLFFRKYGMTLATCPNTPLPSCWSLTVESWLASMARRFYVNAEFGVYTVCDRWC